MFNTSGERRSFSVVVYVCASIGMILVSNAQSSKTDSHEMRLYHFGFYRLENELHLILFKVNVFDFLLITIMH